MIASSDYQSLESTSDLHVVETRPLVSPSVLHNQWPNNENTLNTVTNARQAIKEILRNSDKRILVIVGPCSIHDDAAAKEYAKHISTLRNELHEKLEIVMRVYFEKPRTTVGWKGLINDPHLDGSYDINTGLRKARALLWHLASQGIPTATELLDPIVPQYIADLISWTAIGARTTESQTHREMASGLSMPIGFKNGTDGSVLTAINAMQAASKSHHFLGINKDGLAAIVNTTGNPDGHVVLRGGAQGTNYDELSIGNFAVELQEAGFLNRVMVDCSHGNSNKNYRKQVDVLANISMQLRSGQKNIMGVMLESHLFEGNQKLISHDLGSLKYGQSITDACIDIQTTSNILRELADSIDI
tara:strand:+ start:6264 stop:7340 length:1077 start_codon:yes stop_codon:yes gene_type:complete